MRLRFAPSPTGQLHVGNARTALFNWLLARGKDGALVLRIEDTDTDRSTRQSEAGIIEDLRWLGLHWDEGPDVGGGHGPYRQSERLHLYASYANELMAGGHAYHCFCSPTKLENDRQADLAAGRPPKYRGTCRNMPPDESRARVDAGERPVVRFKVPEQVQVSFQDLVRGEVAFSSEVIGDPVLVRSDGRPAYNFAVVVDDALMEITHVIRGRTTSRTRRGRCSSIRRSGSPLPRSRIWRWSWGPITRRCRSAMARHRWPSFARAAFCRRR